MDQTEKKMVLIPGGTFMMGAVPGQTVVQGLIVKDDEMPAHEVTVDAFYMDATPVTQREFESVMGYNPSTYGKAPFSPVETVSRDEAIEYCRDLGAGYSLVGAEGLTINAAHQPCEGYPVDICDCPIADRIAVLEVV